MFLLKKVLALLLLPLPVCLILMFSGLLLLWTGRRQKLGRALMTVGTVLLALLSLTGVPELAVRSLESRYATLTGPPVGVAPESVRWVVVLGGGHSTNPAEPALSRLDGPTLKRLVEGVRLISVFPQARLLLSGGRVFDSTSQAEVMAQAARELGVPDGRLVLEAEGRDTAEEAERVRRIVGNDRFALVTSAWHEPRAMAEFRRVGMDPIPAPCDLQHGRSEGWSLDLVGPNARRLALAECAIHEYLGMAWAWLRG